MSRNSRLENASNSEIDAVLSELEGKLERLRVSYERYFSGIDRTPPEFLRKDVVRLLRMLEQTFIRNTAQKFRLNTCAQKMATYSTYWNRTQRQIEEGTFKRDQQKARRNQEQRARQAEDSDQEKEDVYELDLDLDLDVDNFLDSLHREFDDSNLQNTFQRPADTVFDRTTGPTELLPSVERQQFERQQQAPTAISPTPPAAFHPNAPENTADNERQAKLDAMRRRLEERSRPQTPPPSNEFSRDEQPETRKATNEVPGMPTGGADYDKLRKLRQMKQRLAEQAAPAPRAEQPRVVQRSSNHPAINPTASATPPTGPQRVIQRRAETPPAVNHTNDPARDVYNKLLEAKKRCNESTANLSFEAVQRSMNEQREHLRQTRGARDVDFQVVIKDGKAYLKPETKK